MLPNAIAGTLAKVGVCLRSCHDREDPGHGVGRTLSVPSRNLERQHILLSSTLQTALVFRLFRFELPDSAAYTNAGAVLSYRSEPEKQDEGEAVSSG